MTYTQNNVTVANTSHQFDANNMTKDARKAVKAAGLATPAHFQVLSTNSPAALDDTPVITAYSKTGRKSVTVTASDIYFAMQGA